jgi:hypothetical protein
MDRRTQDVLDKALYEFGNSVAPDDSNGPGTSQA